MSWSLWSRVQGTAGKSWCSLLQADVVRQEVQGPVVRVGLGDRDPIRGIGLRGRHGRIHVVLGDEVAGERVQAPGQEGGEHEVEHGLHAERAEDHGVEGELRRDVQGRYPGEGDAVHGHGAESVEEDLKGAEEGFAKDGVEETWPRARWAGPCPSRRRPGTCGASSGRVGTRRCRGSR